MMMPSCPTPDFVIAHPQQLLPVFKTRLDGPPHPPPALSAPLERPLPGAPAAGDDHAHATAGGVSPGVLPRLAYCGALRQNTTDPAPPRHPESPDCSQTPRPPPPNDTAAPGS